MSAWLDTIHPAARSALVLGVLAPLVALVGTFTAAILSAGGIDVAWADTLGDGIDAAAVVFASGVGTFVALYATPLTRRYGVGSGDPAATPADPAEGLGDDA